MSFENLNFAKELQQQLEGWIGAEPWPPVKGVTYTACAVYPGSAGKLSALVIAHLDELDEFSIDLVQENVSEAAADRVAKRYRIPVQLFTRTQLDEAKLPLAQAVGTVHMLLRPPPKKPPIWCRSWRHGILFHRIGELRDAEYKASARCWEGGVMVRDLPFDGALATELIGEAIAHFEADELDEAEGYCLAAERVMVGRHP